MADLEQLKGKYAPVITTIQSFSEFGAKVDSVDLDGDKLRLKGEVPSQVIANRVWDVIKQCDPQYADLEHQIATTGGAEQKYTIKAGDNLSKVSKLFYGDANKYEQIAKASGLADANKIHPGDEVTVPVLS